jgi:L1 cell adhesion molecule like protein
MRSAKAIRSNSENGTDRLQGIIPAISDWHTKVSFLGVIYNRLYTNESKGDSGTMSQLKNLINRTNVPVKPKQNVNAADHFFQVVVIAHVIAATLHFFYMNDVHDTPADFLSLLEDTNSPQSQQQFHSAIVKMISCYVDINQRNEVGVVKDKDQVRAYAREVLSLGLLLLEFDDSVHEGDGERLIRVWKYLMLIFRAKRKTKYALESLNLLFQANLFLPPRLRQQLLYSRFVNTRGIPGANILIDLHVEHVNRVIKGM